MSTNHLNTLHAAICKTALQRMYGIPNWLEKQSNEQPVVASGTTPDLPLFLVKKASGLDKQAKASLLKNLYKNMSPAEKVIGGMAFVGGPVITGGMAALSSSETPPADAEETRRKFNPSVDPALTMAPMTSKPEVSPEAVEEVRKLYSGGSGPYGSAGGVGAASGAEAAPSSPVPQLIPTPKAEKTLLDEVPIAGATDHNWLDRNRKALLMAGVAPATAGALYLGTKALVNKIRARRRKEEEESLQ